MARLTKMWEFPGRGLSKINVHAVYYENPLPNGNTNGIGVVLRSQSGSIIKMISGPIPNLTKRASELWAMLVGLRSAYYEGEKKLMLESDQDEAVREWEGLRWFIDENHYDLIHQLEQRKNDPNGQCQVSAVHGDRNRVARFLAEDGARNRNRLVVSRRVFGRVRDLWMWDMGLGPSAPQYEEVEEGYLLAGEQEEEHGDIEEAAWLVEGADSASMGHI